jgi:hypothetical protein
VDFGEVSACAVIRHQFMSAQSINPDKRKESSWYFQLYFQEKNCFVVMVKHSGVHNSPLYKIVFFLLFYVLYCIQHCFICRPSDATVSSDAEMEPRTVSTTALTVRRSKHSAKSQQTLIRWFVA